MDREFELIDRLGQWFSTPDGVSVGIGDDAAVLENDRFDLVAMDTLIEGVHFRRDFSEACDIGWKALAVNASDIAAMGGRSGPLFLSLALPDGLETGWVEEFCVGINEASQALVGESGRVSAAGGDLSSTTGPIAITVTLLGETSPQGPVLRTGARPGDRIVVTRTPGRSAAGLAVLMSDLERDRFAELVGIHRRPRPDTDIGPVVAQQELASAMIDVSDGLLQDLRHLLEASEVRARVSLQEMTVPTSFAQLEEAGLGPMIDWIVGGGEDFCLLMTVPPQKMPELRERGEENDWTLCEIGVVRPPDERLEVVGLDGEPLDASSPGYRHFEEP